MAGVIATAAVAVAAATAGIRPVRIVSNSMHPTMKAGDWIVASRLEGIDALDRGDVVVFRFPPGSDLRAVKRVVALPGDTVDVAEDEVRVNGTPRRTGGAPTPRAAEARTATVPHGHVFLLGDNGPNSIDSRSFGPAPATELVGLHRATLRRTAVQAALAVSGVAVVVLLAVAWRLRRRPAGDPA